MLSGFEKHVLITGCAGFIGSHCLEYFIDKYPHYHFTGIDKLNYASSYSTKYLTNILNNKNFTFIEKDLSEEFDFLFNLIVNSAQIDTIIHIAAESCVDRSFTQPLYFTRNNVLSSQNLLECVRLAKSQNQNLPIQFIHVSTDEVYGEQRINESVDEKASLNPTNPYAASKAAVDIIAQAYKHSYNIPLKIVRSNNVYGPRQYPEKIIPMAMQSLCDRRKIRIHGNGSNKRNYLHVSDFVRGLDLIWHSESIGEVFNLGNEEEIDNLSLVKLICEIYFDDKTIDYKKFITFVKDREFNDARYSLNLNKLKMLGWKPEIDLKGGIEELVKEYR
ncbi:uncharacterized protein PRCAT00000075001 [Priceomyces carsonii]|uniref:uncharacterized protein n=1 Tax=Priceomyces carsonii TaxID=28549 RepID=UPI002EDADEDA|nr:unnamed protein product [Priceomyces carsonii]